MINLNVAHKNFVKKLKNEGRSDSTLLAYGKDIEQLTEYLFKKGINTVDQIELTHLQEFMNKLAKDELTPKSISRKTNSTKTFFKYLHIEGHVKENVAEFLKHPKVDNKAPRILSKVEYRALRDAAKDDLRASAIIEVLLQTGVTISELAEIKIEHIEITEDSSEGSLHIPKKDSRGTRMIPLNKTVIEAIKKYLNQERPKEHKTPHLFITKTGNSLLIRNIRSTIDRFFKLAGVESAKVNDLRHTFVAHHLAQGMNMLHLSRISGHKRISTTEKYLQYIEKPATEEKTELGAL